MCWTALGRAPYAELPPEDISLLAADPALRARYCEFVLTALLPPLRRMSEILGTKFHLKESVVPTRLAPLLPGIGRDWMSFHGSLSDIYFSMRVYAAQLESLAGRWEEERYDLLQPNSPGPHQIPRHDVSRHRASIKDVGKEEVELDNFMGFSSQLFLFYIDPSLTIGANRMA
jgi:hypothetical protein